MVHEFDVDIALNPTELVKLKLGNPIVVMAEYPTGDGNEVLLVRIRPQS